MSYVNSKLQQRLREDGGLCERHPCGRKLGKQFPEQWIVGPDPWLHDQYYAWHKHRSQARFRGEDYEFTWEDWQYFWFKDDLWQQRGRERHSLILTRIDEEKAWSRDNCQIITRLEHLRAKVNRKMWKLRKTKNGTDNRI